MKSCGSCSELLADDARFCPSCGAPQVASKADPLLGTVVADRYVLKERVGSGKSGVIYRAEHTALRSRFAIKLLHPGLSDDEAAIERYQAEATQLAQLDSDHIVKVSDFGRAEDERLFFAMEFLEGETLEEALEREGTMDEEKALELIEQVGEALSDAHEVGIVHGDIRPRNIYLAKKKRKTVVKLLDFGLAKLTATGSSPDAKEGAGVADPRFLSPEQARGEEVTAASDIYSLGLLAYTLVAGVPPFEGTPFEVLTQHIENNPRPLATRAAGISPSYAGAVTRALSKTATERFGTVEGMLSSLSGDDTQPDSAGAAAAATGKPEDDNAVTNRMQRVPGDELEQAIKRADELSPAATLRDPEIGKAAAAAAKAAQAAPNKAAAPTQAKPAAAKAAPAASKAAPATAQSGGDDDDSRKLSRKEKKRKKRETASQPQASAGQTDDAAATKLGHGFTADDVKAVAGGGAAAAAAVAQAARPAGQQPAPVKAAPAAAGAAAQPAKSPAPSAESGTATVVDPPKAAAPAAAAAATPAASSAGADGGAAAAKTAAGGQPEQFSDSDVLGSETGNWFAEGVAAENALKTRTSSAPLPAIYGDVGDDIEPIRRTFSPGAIIGVVVVVAAVVFGIVVFATGGDDGKKKNTGSVVPKAASDGTGSANAAAGSASGSGAASAGSAAAAGAGSAAAVAKNSAAAALAGSAAAAGSAKKPAAGTSAGTTASAARVAKKAPDLRPNPHTRKRKVVAKKAPPPPKRRTRRRVRVTKVASTAPVRPPAKKKSGRDPAQARFHVKMGKRQLRRGGYTKAREEFNKALKLDPRSAAAHGGLGEVAFEMGFVAKAGRHLRSALRFSPRSSRLLVMLGHVYFKQGKTGRALQQYRKALRYNPRSRAARGGINAALRKLGKQ